MDTIIGYGGAVNIYGGNIGLAYLYNLSGSPFTLFGTNCPFEATRPRVEWASRRLRWRDASAERYLRCRLPMSNLLLVIIVLLLLFGWGGGMAMHAGGNLIHALLVIAVIVVVVRLLTGRRAV